MANTFIHPPRLSSDPNSYMPTTEEQNRRVHWATVIDKSIITASDCPPARDKSLTTTPSTFAPAQSPQLPRLRNQQMPLIKTFMPANMDSSDNGDRQDTLWTIKYPRKPVVGSSKRIWKLWNKGQRHESPFHGKDHRKGALDLRYNVESAIWLGMQIYMECDGE